MIWICGLTSMDEVLGKDRPVRWGLPAAAGAPPGASCRKMARTEAAGWY